jgi:MFS family permease
MSITRETILERRQQTLRWSAVFAGAAVSVGLWLLLQTLGAGIGLSTVDPNDPNSLRSAGIGTGIWTVIAPLIALFIGGVVAGRVSGTISRRSGAIHGLVLWSISAVLGFAALLMLASGFARGMAIANRDAVATSGDAIGLNHGGPRFESVRPRNDVQSRQAAADVGSAMLWSGLAMLLGLGAAIGGGAAGVRALGTRGRYVVRHDGRVIEPPPVPPVAPVADVTLPGAPVAVTTPVTVTTPVDDAQRRR